MTSGQDSFALGRAFATTIKYHFGDEVDVLYGPACKGIPLAVMAAQYYGGLCGRDTHWCFDRPAVEGDPLRMYGGDVNERRVVIIDDVLASGDTIREAISALKLAGGMVLGACVLVDQRERNKNGHYAVDSIDRDTGVKVVSCAAIGDLVQKLAAKLPNDERDAA